MNPVSNNAFLSDQESINIRNWHNQFLPKATLESYLSLARQHTLDLRTLPLTIGKYRIYHCRRRVVGLDAVGNLLLQDRKTGPLEIAEFGFESCSSSASEPCGRFHMNMFVNGNPIVPVGNRIACVAGASSHTWMLLPDTGTNQYSIVSVREKEKNELEKWFWALTYNRSTKILQLGLKLCLPDFESYPPMNFTIIPTDLSIAEGTYNIYFFGPNKKLLALGLDDEREIVALHPDASPSAFAKFTFTLRSENASGTFMNIHVEGDPIVPWDNHQIKCISGEEPYAWEVYLKDMDIFSIFSYFETDYYGARRSWFACVTSDIPIPRLILVDPEETTFRPGLWFIKPSVD